jgi:hypothetical protein
VRERPVPRLSRKRKIDPNGVYMAWQSAALLEPNLTIVKGTRMKGDHPAVQYHPWLFVPDGVSDEEVAHVRGDTEKTKQWEPTCR